MCSVLVVDDHVPTAKALARNLRRAPGRVVHVAHDPDTAIEVARRERPDIALVDGILGPSHRSGYELVVELKRDLPRCRIWMWSGSSTEEYCKLAKDCGAEELFEKPVLLAELTLKLFGKAQYAREDTLEAVKEGHIKKVVRATGGNKSEGARYLGVTRTAFQRTFKKATGGR
jgi:ActR/RegA family two-component response regulator